MTAVYACADSFGGYRWPTFSRLPVCDNGSCSKGLDHPLCVLLHGKSNLEMTS